MCKYKLVKNGTNFQCVPDPTNKCGEDSNQNNSPQACEFNKHGED